MKSRRDWTVPQHAMLSPQFEQVWRLWTQQLWFRCCSHHQKCSINSIGSCSCGKAALCTTVRVEPFSSLFFTANSDARCIVPGPRRLLAPYFAEMGLPCPNDTDPADFYVSYLSDPVALWESEVARRRAINPEYTPGFTPPLTTEDMQLYFRASMHRGQWSILRPYDRVGDPFNELLPLVGCEPMLCLQWEASKDAARVHESEPSHSETKQDAAGASTSPIPSALSRRSSDIIPKGETPNLRDFKSRDGPSVLHIADTACVSAHTVPVDMKTEFNRKQYGNAYMQGFGRQLKVTLAFWLGDSCSSMNLHRRLLLSDWNQTPRKAATTEPTVHPCAHHARYIYGVNRGLLVLADGQTGLPVENGYWTFGAHATSFG
jgi:hypothetical protein